MSRTSLYKLADELRVNPNTCGRANSIWIRIRVDVETFECAKKNLRIQKYSDTSGRGLSHRVDGPIPKLFVGIRIQSDDLLFAFIILGFQPRKRWLFSWQKIPSEIRSLLISEDLSYQFVWRRFSKVMQALDFVSRYISVSNRPFAWWRNFTTTSRIL